MPPTGFDRNWRRTDNDRRTRVLRVNFDSPPDPDRFSKKERCYFAVVVLYSLEVKRQLRTFEAGHAYAAAAGGSAAGAYRLGAAAPSLAAAG